MKRDMKLVRKILECCEADKACGIAGVGNISIDGYDRSLVIDHCMMMMLFGLMDDRISPAAVLLTWAGHDMLDKLRCDDDL